MCTVDGSRQPPQARPDHPVASRPRLARVLLHDGHPIEGGPHEAQAHPVARPGPDPLPGHRPGRERPRRLACSDHHGSTRGQRHVDQTPHGGTQATARLAAWNEAAAKAKAPRGGRQGGSPRQQARQGDPAAVAHRPAGRLPARGHHVLRQDALRRLARRRRHLARAARRPARARSSSRASPGSPPPASTSTGAGACGSRARRITRSASTACGLARCSRPTRSRPPGSSTTW